MSTFQYLNDASIFPQLIQAPGAAHTSCAAEIAISGGTAVKLPPRMLRDHPQQPPKSGPMPIDFFIKQPKIERRRT
jgi:hypothetical protein